MIMSKRIFCLVLILVAFGGCTHEKIILSSEKEGKNLETSQKMEIHTHQLYEKHAQAHGITTDVTREFFFKQYGLENEKQIYEKLPYPPATFEGDANQLYSGKVERVNEIPANVYRQPEFHPLFARQGVRAWTEAKSIAQTVIGITSFPAEQTATVDAARGGIETALFVSSAWGAAQSQATGFRYTVQPAGPIEVRIEPNEIVLGPTFPRFSEDWIQKIKIQIKWNSKLEAGTYEVTLYPDVPSESFVRRLEPNVVYAGSNGIGMGEGLATLTLQVEAN